MIEDPPRRRKTLGASRSSPRRPMPPGPRSRNTRPARPGGRRPRGPGGLNFENRRHKGHMCCPSGRFYNSTQYRPRQKRGHKLFDSSPRVWLITRTGHRSGPRGSIRGAWPSSSVASAGLTKSTFSRPSRWPPRRRRRGRRKRRPQIHEGRSAPLEGRRTIKPPLTIPSGSVRSRGRA